MSKAKARIIEAMPPQLREFIKKFRRALDPVPIETRILRSYGFQPDPTEKARLTLLLPSLSKTKAFGGVTTTRDLFISLANILANDIAVDIRIIVEDQYDPTSSVLDDTSDINVESLLANAWTIGTRRHELFLVFNWWIALNIDGVLAEQAEHFNQPVFTKFYLFQEYEPNFYPFSSANILATQALNSTTPQHIIFNTKELFDFYSALNNQCEKSYVFEPFLSDEIKPFLNELETVEKERIILVYGRPGVERNCFTILEEGLKTFARTMPKNQRAEDGGWTICSAGLKHPDIKLGNGYFLKSLGKLSLEEYGTLLCRSAVGVSLMASPHPSYPPLEMAHFGLRTITNNYANKNMSARHENLLPLPKVHPDELGRALVQSCNTFDQMPNLGLKAESHMPGFVEGGTFSCLDDVARDMLSILSN